MIQWKQSVSPLQETSGADSDRAASFLLSRLEQKKQ